MYIFILNLTYILEILQANGFAVETHDTSRHLFRTIFSIGYGIVSCENYSGKYWVKCFPKHSKQMLRSVDHMIQQQTPFIIYVQSCWTTQNALSFSYS